MATQTSTNSGAFYGSSEPYPFASQFAAAGVPSWVAQGVEHYEGAGLTYSSTQPDTGGTTSVGPLQINTGGQGSGYTASQLAASPALQASLGVPPIASAYKSAVSQGLSGFPLFVYVMSHSGHPGGSVAAGYTPSTADLQNYAASYQAATGQQVPPSESALFSGPSTVPLAATTTTTAAASGAGGLEQTLLSAAQHGGFAKASLLAPSTWLPAFAVLALGVVGAALLIGAGIYVWQGRNIGSLAGVVAKVAML